MKEKEAAVITRIRLPTTTSANATWKRISDAICQATRSVLATTMSGRHKIGRQAWMWTDDLKSKFLEKKSLYDIVCQRKTVDNCRANRKRRKLSEKRWL